MSELEQMKNEFKDTFFNDAWDEEETSIMEIKWDALLDKIIEEAQSPLQEALDDIEKFIANNRRICWEAAFENGEYCIGENKIREFFYNGDIHPKPEKLAKKEEQR